MDTLHANRPVAIIDGKYYAYGADNQWTQVSAEAPLGGYDSARLYIHPTDPNVLYAVDTAVRKSTDGGVHWTMVSNTTGAYRALASHKAAPNTLLAANQRGWGGNTGGVLKSMNGGVNWISSSAGITAQPIRGLAIDPRNCTQG